MTDLGEKLFGCALATASAVNIYWAAEDLMDYNRMNNLSYTQNITKEDINDRRLVYTFGLAHAGLAGLCGALSFAQLKKE